MKRFGRQYESELSFALRSGFAQMDTGWTRARLILRCKNYPFAGSSADDECGARFSLIDTTNSTASIRNPTSSMSSGSGTQLKGGVHCDVAEW